MVFGMVKDKDRSTVLSLLPQKAQYYFVNPNLPRALDSTLLQEEAKGYNLIGRAFTSVLEGYAAALKSAKVDDLVFVGGSTFVVAEVI